MAQATLVQVDAAHARVVITPSYTGADTVVAVLLQRSEDAGQHWTDVRGDIEDGVVSMLGGTSRQFPDYEVPFDVPVLYRTIKSDVNGNAIGTTFNLSATVIVPSGAACLWWIHPTDDPTQIGGFVPVADGGAKLGALRSVQYGNQAVYPITQLGPRQARSSATFSLIARSNTEALSVVAALGSPAVLCVRTPASHGWSRRFIVVLDITEAHPAPIQGGGWVYKAAYVETARPTNALEVFGASYDQLAASFATYGALAAGFGTYDDQTIGLP